MDLYKLNSRDCREKQIKSNLNRESRREQERIADLLRLIPEGLGSILDVGARDGYLSRLLVEKCDRVTALDLNKPEFDHPNIIGVAGDVSALQFADEEFDVVLCAEVLEHIQPDLVIRACRELARVARSAVIVGVPYRQDLRIGRTLCRSCGRRNPPWGHVNAFDENRLMSLFDKMDVDEVSLIGNSRERTNIVSSWLMDRAGNPYGTYGQEETCIYCDASITPAPSRGFVDKVLAKLAIWLQTIQPARSKPRWVHIRFAARRPDAPES